MTEKKNDRQTARVWAGILIAALPGAVLLAAAAIWAGPTIRKLIDVVIKVLVKG